MKKYLSLSFKGLFLLAFILGCLACGKQYVGMQVNTSGWSQIYQLPAKCSQYDQWFVWKYSIEKDSKENEYTLIGTAHGSRGGAKSVGNIVIAESRFSLILANNGTVVDNIPFRLRGGDINAPIPFEKKFECQSSFNAAAIFWSAKAQG
jgi:hypothetical protein